VRAQELVDAPRVGKKAIGGVAGLEVCTIVAALDLLC
jgi:hypothetical protein